MTSTGCSVLPLESIVTTSELERRPARAPDYQREAAALRRLSIALNSDASNIFKILVQEAKAICGSDSAGISLAEEEDGAPIFRWKAIAGDLEPFVNGTMPRHFSPCGVVVARNATQMMQLPERHFPYIEQLGIPITEVLLVPFYNEGEPIGTLWIVAHSDARRFDAEDQRIVQSLAEFAGTAIQIYQKTQRIEQQHSAHTALLQAAAEGIFGLDRQGHCTFANRAALKILGYTQEEIIGLMLACPKTMAAMESGKMFREDNVPMTRKSGEGFPAYCSTAPMFDSNRNVIGAVVSFHDATERNTLRAQAKILSDAAEKSHERAEESHKKLYDVLMWMPIGIGIMEGPEHRFTLVNEAHAKFYGGRTDFLGKPVREAIPELHKSGLDQVLDRVYQTGETFNGEEFPIELVQADGTPRAFYLTFSYQALRDRLGQVYGVVATVLDVTEIVVARNNAQAASDRIAHAERLLSDAVTVAKVGFYDWDIVEDKFSLSQQFQEDWGIADGMTLQDGFNAILPEDHQRVQALIDKAMQERTGYTAEYRIKRPTDGRIIWIHARGNVTFDDEGRPLRFFGTTIDITAQKAIEAEIIEARNEAIRANSAKSSFLANMSHELRSPLGAITGFVELLKNKDLTSQEAEEFVTVIDRNSRHLLRLLDDILDLAKVEAGKMVMEQLSFSIVDLLYDFAAQARLRAADKSIAFDLQIEPGIPDTIEADPTRIRQILENIVGNAIKFTQFGRVRLAVSYQQGKFHFRVDDTGIGITPEQQKILFQSFQQADVSTTRNYGGTGLGLILTRKLAEAMHGSFRLVSSFPGVGSTFVATLAVRVASPPKPMPTGTYAASKRARILAGMKVLLVEDSQDNQLLFSRMLASVGAEVDRADDGVEGVNLAMSKAYNVVLMDVQMPRMDGHEATRILRDRNYRGPIIALTAHAMKEEQDKARTSGFSDYLSKPFRMDDLIDKLSRLHLS